MTLPAESFRLESPLFQGTLGELVRLARHEDVDLLELALVQLVQEVLGFLFGGGAPLNLEIAGTYLFELASLLELKSRKLLPNTQILTLTEDEEEEFTEEELEKRLARRLMDYAKYRNVAEELRSREAVQSKRFFKLEPADPTHRETLLEEVSLYDMLRVLRQMLERAPKVTELSVAMESISIEDAMAEVQKKLRSASGPIRFVELFAPMASRTEIVVTFLSILELIFRRQLRLRQDTAFGEIVVDSRQPEPETETQAAPSQTPPSQETPPHA